jgi:mRNA interferase MazF
VTQLKTYIRRTWVKRFTSLELSVIWRLHTRLPLLETEKNKVRPVIVISKPRSEHNIVIVVPVSSQAGQEDVDIALSDWQAEGLVKPSIARTHRLSALLQSELTSQLGELSANDLNKLLGALKKLLIL